MPFAVALAALAGAALGPVLHHLGVRAAVRAPFDGPAARCESCAAVRAPAHWFGPRCRSCATPIRRREPLIWALAAAGLAGAVIVTDGSWLLPAHLWFAALTTVLVVTDLDEKLIPNRVLYPGTTVALALLAGGALAEGRAPDLGRAAAAGAGYFGMLFIVALIARGGFGMGDVKLAVLLGAFLGFQGWETLATGVFLTGILGGLPAVYLLATGKATRGHEIAYGPPMILGAWLALVL
jgi:leader peptidase (prepilin peptidase) / N-methyltransferase